jgi:hypothetical protein
MRTASRSTANTTRRFKDTLVWRSFTLRVSSSGGAKPSSVKSGPVTRVVALKRYGEEVPTCGYNHGK